MLTKELKHLDTGQTFYIHVIFPLIITIPRRPRQELHHMTRSWANLTYLPNLGDLTLSVRILPVRSVLCAELHVSIFSLTVLFACTAVCSVIWQKHLHFTSKPKLFLPESPCTYLPVSVTSSQSHCSSKWSPKSSLRAFLVLRTSFPLFYSTQKNYSDARRFSLGFKSIDFGFPGVTQFFTF